MAEITPFLWFDSQAGEALDFYSSVFVNSQVVNVSRNEDSSSPSGGFVMGTIRVENLTISVFNGGPYFLFNEAISLFVSCDTQEEVDYYWNALVNGGAPSQCGWLKDRFGVSWQIVPKLLGELMGDPDREKSSRVRDAMMAMTKIESALLLEAFHRPT